MVNVPPVTVKLGNQVLVWDDTTMKILSLNRTLSGSSAGNSLRGLNDVDYQEPVGKVFYILEAQCFNTSGSGNSIRMSHQTVVNTDSSATRFSEINANGDTQCVKYNCRFQVDAGQYIGCSSTGGSAQWQVTGVEMDA